MKVESGKLMWLALLAIVFAVPEAGIASVPPPFPVPLNLVPVFMWFVKFLTSCHLFPNFEG